MRLLLSAALVVGCVAILAACPGKGGGPSGPREVKDGGQNPVANDECTEAGEHARKLYAAAATEKDAELAADLLQANVDMVLDDCQKEPARIAPCIKAATTVEVIEQSCLIQLDDDGVVDGHALKSGD